LLQATKPGYVCSKLRVALLLTFCYSWVVVRKLSTQARPRKSSLWVTATSLVGGVAAWGAAWLTYSAYTYAPEATNFGLTTSALLDEDRIVSFASLGPSNAKSTVFAWPSKGGSRLDLVSLGLDNPDLLKKYSVRVITVDRPGYGNSGTHFCHLGLLCFLSLLPLLQSEMIKQLSKAM